MNRKIIKHSENNNNNNNKFKQFFMLAFEKIFLCRVDSSVFI